jgi:S-adenosylmethionine:tRNA ribosyltransferase-isomerase
MVADSIIVAPIVLHTGLSSLEAGEAPQAERFRVPPTTARLVNETRAAKARSSQSEAR